MVRAIAAWIVVAVSGFLILPKALAQLIHYPWFYAPLLAVWLTSLMVAAAVSQDAVKRRKRPTSG